jgi:hypothetical protein
VYAIQVGGGQLPVAQVSLCIPGKRRVRLIADTRQDMNRVFAEGNLSGGNIIR